MTNVRNRLRAAWDGLRRGPQPTIQFVKHGNTFDWSKAPTWQLGRGEGYAREGFSQNSPIYAAVMFKSRAMTSVPLRAARGTPDQPDWLESEHPLSQLCLRPNEYSTRLSFQMMLSALWNVFGYAYVWFPRESDVERIPKSMHLLPPSRVIPVENTKTDLPGDVLGYVYLPEGASRENAVPIVLRDMMTVKMPNLIDWTTGMSPIAPAARSADVDNSVTEFLKLFFENGALPAGVLKFMQPMDEDQVARARRRWKEIYGGYEQWTDVAILDQGGTFEKMGLTFEEMGFVEIDERNEARILGPLGVPPILVGARIGLKHSTYSNYQTARTAFWEDTFDPELKLLEDGYNAQLATPQGEFVMYDRSAVPALKKDLPALSAAAINLWRMGMPASQALETVGIPSGDFFGGDLPGNAERDASLQAVDGEAPVDVTPPPNQPQQAPSGMQPAKSLTPKEAKVVGGKVERIAANWEKRFEASARAAFEHDRREILAMVSDAAREARSLKATVNWTSLAAKVAEYLAGPSVEFWKSEFVPVMEGVALDVGAEWASALGLQFDVRNLQGEAWFADHVLEFAQPISSTTASDIQNVISQAAAEGWTTHELERRLGQVFDQYISGGIDPSEFDWLQDRMPQYRRELIARLETMRAANKGTFELGKSWGVQEKEWLATHDTRTRPTHWDANGQTVPFDKPFIVGGYELMHPHDSSLGAPMVEVAGCRCTYLLLGVAEE